jgi:hypothetical protein
MTTGIQLIKLGDRVLITGSHPWAGHTGEFVRQENVQGFGIRPVVRLDSGQEIFVMRPEQWERVK